MNSAKSPSVTDDDMYLDLRAPYIPMDGSDDQLFSTNWVPVVDDDMFNSHMIGITESVFEPRPPEMKEDQNTQKKTPLSILRLQASSQQQVQGGEVARTAGPPKMKKPRETNRLETGPPEGLWPSKLAPTTHNGSTSNSNQGSKYVPSIQDILSDTPCSRNTSVLMNLLTKGEDVNYGYRVPAAKPINEVFRGDGSSLRELLLSSDDESDVIEMIIDSDDDQPEDGFLSPMGNYSKMIGHQPTSGINGTNVYIVHSNNGLLFTPAMPTGNT